MKKKIFSSYKYKSFPLPNLLEVQIHSYKWFLDKGLAELFKEISPIEDYTGTNLELSFGEYYFDESKYSQDESKDHFTSYEAPLRVKVRLKNKRTGEIKEQEIYLGDFPLMTSRGTFIINGVERVIVSQLIRSSGVFFTVQNTRNKNQFGAKIIPNRGAWLEFETDYDGVISVKIDRKRKVPVTSLFRIFGLSDDEAIMNAFERHDASPEISYIKNTLAKDTAKSASEAYIEIYKRIRPGDMATADNAKSLIDAMFGSLRYDISEVGRWKMGERLNHLKIENSTKSKNPLKEKDLNKNASDKVLHLADLVAIISEIIKLNNDPHAKADDIDHLGNRRVRAMGELVQQRLRLGLARLERIAKDRMSTLDANTITPAQLVNARPLIAVVKEFFASSQLSQFM
ncbi:MAG: DNA-directed RNA polymerase subunit beta, partial [Patescibacteria group bacterium]